jgi:NADH:ubiquinone reductase (non-electrogenic)
MYARIRMGLFGTAAVAAAGKALILTMSDDWDDVFYSARKAVTFHSPPARKPRVVVLGSGWGALSFIRKLDQAEVDLTIVSPRPFFFYTPLLAGTATGTVSHGSIVEPVRWYCDRAGHGGAKYIQADCTSIDPHAKRLSCTIPGATHTPPSSLALEYDYLVISVGAEPATFNIPGVREHTRFIKEVEDGIAIQKDILQKLELASALQAAGEWVVQSPHWGTHCHFP